MVLDSFRLQHPQAHEDGRTVTTEEQILELCRSEDGEMKLDGKGLTLSELSGMLWKIGIGHVVCFADEFKNRDMIERVLLLELERGRRIIVNYHMSVAGQEPWGGHFSPLAGYNEDTNEWLVLDTWKHTNGPVWLANDKFIRSILEIDKSSNRSRGFIIVRNTKRRPNIVLKPHPPTQELVDFVNNAYASIDFHVKHATKRIEDGEDLSNSACLLLDGNIVGTIKLEPSMDKWGMLTISEQIRGEDWGGVLIDWAETRLLMVSSEQDPVLHIQLLVAKPEHLNLKHREAFRYRAYFTLGYRKYDSYRPEQQFYSCIKPEFRDYAHFVKMRLEIPSRASRLESLRRLELEIAGKKRKIGTFPSSLHGDLRHVITGLARRKKPRISLSKERLEKVELAMKNASDCPFDSIQQYKATLEQWRRELTSGFDAREYYDACKAEKYSEHNVKPQKNLTVATMDMLPLGNGANVLLDIGCGSGLSSHFAHQHCPQSFPFVIGTDISFDMLHAARSKFGTILDVVQADMRQPSPFRHGRFQHVISVSALHFLNDEKSMKACAATIGESSEFAAQFFPERTQDAIEIARHIERAEIVIDYPHQQTTEQPRFFLVRCPSKLRQSCLLQPELPFPCALLVPGARNKSWLEHQHEKFANKLARTYRFDPKLISNPEQLRVAEQLAKQRECENIVDLLH